MSEFLHDENLNGARLYGIEGKRDNEATGMSVSISADGQTVAAGRSLA